MVTGKAKRFANWYNAKCGQRYKHIRAGFAFQMVLQESKNAFDHFAARKFSVTKLKAEPTQSHFGFVLVDFVTAAVQQLMAEHYESWVSEKIPALDGRTPLEAARDAEGREKVLALLIDAERHARRMKPPVSP